MPESLKEARQLYLFEDTEVVTELDARLWHGSFNSRESSLQQLSPYVGKMKSGMARVLVNLYSKPGDTVLDPFSGSGVVPLEAALAGRRAWANDLSPYAYALTRGKLEAPGSRVVAIERATIASWPMHLWMQPPTLVAVRRIIFCFCIRSHGFCGRWVNLLIFLPVKEDFAVITSCQSGFCAKSKVVFITLIPGISRESSLPTFFPPMYTFFPIFFRSK